MSRTDRYDAEARSWAIDTQVREARLQRIAWTIAGIATAVALFEAVALALLTPLKTVQPVTLLVDRQTGFVQALDPARPQRVSADVALTQSLLAQYVSARESYDRATVRNDYRHVALWSGGLARSQYLKLMVPTNPDGPIQRFAGGATLTAAVKSVSPFGPGVALVRFDTRRVDRTGTASVAHPWVAVLRYRYLNAPMRFEDRLINPLGFQIMSYRRDPEAAIASDAPVGAAVSKASSTLAMSGASSRPTTNDGSARP